VRSQAGDSSFIQEARSRTLAFFNAPPSNYQCIFTSGATASLALLADAFPWSHDSKLFHTVANHTYASACEGLTRSHPQQHHTKRTGHVYVQAACSL
jgi:selenocysteine lyase/cysteine desulfurase